MDQRPAVIRLAVFGSPISQSLSPAIHGRFARQCGLDVDYRAIEATGGNFAGLLRKLVAQGGRGCNITAPLKNEAWKLAHSATDSAQRAQAANTLLFSEPDAWLADNTDGRGLVQDLSANLDQEIGGSRICIIGAGGATAGILGDLLEQKPACITIANRTLERAQALQRAFNTAGGTPVDKNPEAEPSVLPIVTAVSLNDLETAGPFDLIINATSLGHAGDAPKLPSTMLLPDSLCYDLNYGAAAEPLRLFCHQSGIRHEDGLGMLVEQAALSFELWTGFKPETGPVLKAMRQM
jgi:shikimate dehydrogenase